MAVCLDLSKAFDSVEHDLLIKKLAVYGIRGVALKLIQSYLKHRKQCVVERDKQGIIIKSEKKIIKRGVPQGSILGPLLYILYTNKLPDVIDQQIVQFADDTSIIFSEIPEKDIKKEILDALNLLNQWFKDNNLQLNVAKTQMITFSYLPQDETILTYDRLNIKSSNTVKFLGINLDCRLDWKFHIDSLAQNMAQYCYALGVVARFVNVEAAFIAYHAYIQSRVRYGIIFWANASDAYRILNLQKKCLRCILDKRPRDSCRNIFREKKILTLFCLYIYEAVIFVKENILLFKTLEHEHNTRYKKNLSTNKINFSYIQKNVEFSITKIYNKLPSELKNLHINKLKRELKQILIKKAYYTIEEYFLDNSFS